MENGRFFYFVNGISRSGACRYSEEPYFDQAGTTALSLLILPNLLFYRLFVKTTLLALLSSAVILSCANIYPQQHRDHLSDAAYGLKNVQDSARTKVWWFHGETETTREGITADLEAFKQMGVGGVVYYDQSHGKAEKALPGFSPEWWKALRFAAEEAKRLKLTFELHLSNGYVAGGPWITYENSMKRLTATETFIQGGAPVAAKLEAPVNPHGFYRDVAVLAFPAPSGAGASSRTEGARITSNLPGFDAQTLFDPQTTSLTKIPSKEEGVYINLEFPHEFTARSITYEVRPKGKATSSATNVPGRCWSCDHSRQVKVDNKSMNAFPISVLSAIGTTPW
jgi:hypothetical protein